MIHEGHPGICAMKSVACFYVWWPSLDGDIERYNLWFKGLNWLVIVDAYSKWLDMIPLSKRAKTNIIKHCRRLFATFDLPRYIVSDNGPQFVSEEFAKFCRSSNIVHTLEHNNTVQRRIDEMSADVENTLCNVLRTEEFSLQVDESTLPQNEALLLAYVRFIKEGKLVQELLFARELLTDTRGESIFRTVEDFFKKKEIPLTNVIAIATDGTPSMLGRHRGFLSYLKEKLPDLLAVHCVIHRQHLVAKQLSDRLHRSLQYVITAVNKIKSSALRERLFSQLCEENDEDFNRLLLHTEFLETEDTELRDNVEKSRADIDYMLDLYFKFNEMNLRLQRDQLNLIKAKTVVTAFIGKLAIFGQNLGRGEYRQFPNLNDLKENGGLPDDVVRSFCDHLSMLHEDMCERYKDILSMMIPDWVLDPFTSLAGVEVTYQEELIEMQANEELKPKIKGGYTSFWLQQEIRQLYPRLWNVAKKFLIPFPSWVERGFSA
ncbi:hypothetical protein M513_13227, partial [Trichuris suis]